MQTLCQTHPEYLQRTSDVRHPGSILLFIAYGGRDKGKPISKQRLSKWLVECLRYTYDKNDLPTPDLVTRPIRWQSHMPTWMGLTLRPFVRLHMHVC